MLSGSRSRGVVAAVLVSLSLSLAGCRATGRAANGYFDWGGKTFTSNPASLLPYYLGFYAFAIAALPLDLFSFIATSVAWSGSPGSDSQAYQGSCLAPSLFLGTTGGILLGAPFYPFGLPWTKHGQDDDHDNEAPDGHSH